MNLLYAGGYRARFRSVVDWMGSDVQSVCELCFGDTWIAEWCRARGIRWTGVDLNPHFCRRARELGFDVIEGDLMSLELPASEVFVMVGSLYHFHDRIPSLFDRIFARTGRLVLSEPVRNLSSLGGLLGRIARSSADPGTGAAGFRFDEASLLERLAAEQRRTGRMFRSAPAGRDLLVEIVAGDAPRPPTA